MRLFATAELLIAFLLINACRADDYYLASPSGSFSTPDWYDLTTSQDFTGPPGAGDNASVGDGTLTLDGGSVNDLMGGGTTFDVEGLFSANTLSGIMTITGSGTLTAGTLMAGQTTIEGGGSLTVLGLCANQNYFDCTGAGSSLNAQGGMDDAGTVEVENGAHVTATEITPSNGASMSIQGSGTMVSVSGGVYVSEGATWDVASGASFQVGGNLVLDGGVSIVNGGGGWSDPQTSIQVSQTLFVGNVKGEFFLKVSNGAYLFSNAAIMGADGGKGNATVTDPGTSWEVGAAGLLVGRNSAGSLGVQNGAQLTFDADSAFGVGTASVGTLVADGPGTVINAPGTFTSFGLDPGGQGSVAVQNQAQLIVGRNFYVGNGGLGTLSLSTTGQVAVLGTTTPFGVGHLAGSVGQVTLSDGASFTSQGPTTVGDSGNGFFLVYGGTVRTAGTRVGATNGSTGTITISGANSYWSDTNLISMAVQPGSTGSVTVANGGSLLASGAIVGEFGQGSLSVHNGGRASFAGVQVGAGPGGVGSVNVSDTNSWVSLAGSLYLGGNIAAGTMTVSNGAAMQSHNVYLGSVPYGSGTLRVSDPGSTWVVAGEGQMEVGGSPKYVFPNPPPPPGFPQGPFLSDEPPGTGQVLVQNSGTLRVNHMLQISDAGMVTLDGTGRIAVGAGDFGAPGTLRVTSGGILFGEARVQGQVVYAQGGIISPGNSPGTLTIEGNLEGDAGGELDIFIGGTNAGSGFSVINVTGTATLGGTLNVILVNGFTPAPGETFPILTAAVTSGNFAQVNGASVSYGAGGITLANVTGTTAPPILSIQPQGQDVVVSWPEAAQGYTLQTTPNLESSVWTAVPTIKNLYVADTTAGPAFFRLVQAPSLAIQRLPSNLLVTWWPSFPGFTLQSTTNLASGPWINVQTSTNAYAFNPNGPATFFRLIH